MPPPPSPFNPQVVFLNSLCSIIVFLVLSRDSAIRRLPSKRLPRIKVPSGSGDPGGTAQPPLMTRAAGASRDVLWFSEPPQPLKALLRIRMPR
jgi:hypothetical protein